jgi:PKD repeat protein
MGGSVVMLITHSNKTKAMKKTTFNFLALASMSLVLTMCAKDEQVTNDTDPVAAFTFTGGDMPAPHKVVFTNTSTNATSYLWDFGDSEQSNQVSPSHIYEEGGSYTVSLIAYKNDRQQTVSKTVVVNNRPNRVKMSRLTLTEYPENNDTVSWDDDSPPDVFYRIANYIGTVYHTSEVITDLPLTSLPADFTQDMPFTFDGINTSYVIRFYDYDDTLSYTYMGGYYFSMGLFVPDDGSGYPAELVFDATGSPVKFTLSVEWINEER